jgi:hypothetical protein
MTTLIEQIEAMRIRMNELATEEHRLVRTLGDALAGADQRLLEDVRGVAAAHEARRGEVLKELQMLAARLFVLPRPREPSAELENVVQLEEPSHEVEPVVHRGDWRRAAANIQEELAYHLKLRAS